ncbi:monosaccharide ABC transporter ATP-binding protein, CUT2 family [Geodermatophilus aquaeductus]|uniref:Monosaccharide ABC transporter ATP-binding protein, CUT2 family n=1 Tax=Geodermatophilus aquaeductus TaxID=1564161 RepID=A0A521FIQ4_9ACTN|nr:sugar ABC transporter ATP-binding protein [Geodermatophilus aquaeductus]SMO96006.1 monosaccharide ABC transporter ATP-binding protein, CUT2 family [Geodermatophilus aquaeductus]
MSPAPSTAVPADPAAVPPPSDPVVAMTGITIQFPGVKALDDVSLRLFPGEVHALMGENGAGKSTLIKALTGVYPYDAGTVTLGGAEQRFTTPADAQAAGISTVYQEVNLCPNLTVTENIVLGREPRRAGQIDKRASRRRARRVLSELHLDIDPRSVLGSHPIAVQQLVAIARAVDIDARVLVLDEPTSSLDAGEVAELFRVVRSLRDRGVAILFVSHFLEQVYEISDRMTVLRNGRLVGEYRTAELPRTSLVRAMIGRELATLEDLERAAPRPVEAGAVPRLAASGLGRKGAIEPADVEVHAGRVVGLAGLLGSGRTELTRLMFGADRATSGHVEVDGKPVRLRTPRTAIARGIAFLSEDRKGEGVVGDLTVRDNVLLALQARRGWLRPIPRRAGDEMVARYIKALDVRPADPGALLRNLSGGNQQKVLLARWLLTEPRLLLLDEPTRGIDIGAKAQIQELVAQLAGEGMSVVFVSAELEEVLRICDSVVVLRDHSKVADLDASDATLDGVVDLIARGNTRD